MKTQLTTSEKINFIFKNNPVLSDYEIDDIYRKVYDLKFSELTGVKFDNGKNLLLNSFSLDYNDSIENNIKKLKSHLGNIDLYDFKLCNRFYYLFDGFFRPDENNYNEFRITFISDNHILIDFVLYLVFGKPTKDLHEAIEFAKENGLTGFTNKFQIKLGNIEIKRYKNGKLILNGLTKEQHNIINTLFEIKKQTRWL